MPVTVKTQREIALMRESGHKLEKVHNALRDIIRPGITTAEINEYGDRLIRELGGIPNFLDYNGYPASICVSVNDEVVHGIPSTGRTCYNEIRELKPEFCRRRTSCCKR